MSFLYNVQELNKLLENFYQLIHTRIVIFDDQFHEIASYPKEHTPFCSLVRSFEPLTEKCKNCDRMACNKAKKINEPYIYKCHTNLTEAIVPIKENKMVYGYIVLGQLIIEEEKDQFYFKITEFLKKTNFNTEKIIQLLDKQPIIKRQRLIAACDIIQMCTLSLIMSKKVALKKSKLSEDIENYVSKNLGEELDITIICDNFQISKSHLCNISKNNYGIGIAKYIRLARIQKAKELLIDTDKPIYLISISVGINDYNYFTKIFKTITGLTPSQFRKSGYNF